MIRDRRDLRAAPRHGTLAPWSGASVTRPTPEVVIGPDRDIRLWGRGDVGRARVARLARSGALAGTRTVVSSAGTKAPETAAPLAAALGCAVLTRERMGENDRSSTGIPPPEAFERVADRVFAAPDRSVRGCESAREAQARIVAEVAAVLAAHPQGDVLFVGHGGVGTLRSCHLAGIAIGRDHDPMPGVGCVFEVLDGARPVHGWRRLETRLARAAAPDGCASAKGFRARGTTRAAQGSARSRRRHGAHQPACRSRLRRISTPATRAENGYGR